MQDFAVGLFFRAICQCEYVTVPGREYFHVLVMNKRSLRNMHFISRQTRAADMEGHVQTTDYATALE